MEKKEAKEFKSYDQQVQLLVQRGLIINDQSMARKVLSEINYYRFINAYGLEFLDKSIEKYKLGTQFIDMYSIYEFDRELRHVLFGYIEKVEVKLRTAIAYEFGRCYGPLGYLSKENFEEKFDIDKFLEILDKEKSSQKSNDCIRHHQLHYKGMPVWVAVEFMSFGTLSNMYKHMRKENQKEIVRNVFEKNPPKPYYFTKWFHQLVKVRNICAHYGRIYNRYFENPKIVTQDERLREIFNVNRLFPILIPLIKILDTKYAERFMTDLATLIDSYPNVNISRLGFPANWDSILNEAIQGKI